MHGKWKPAYDSTRKYNKDWEKKFSWLKKAPNELNQAYCKLCHCTLAPKLTNIADHKKTEKHKKHIPIQGQQLIGVTSTLRSSHKVDDGVKKAELHLAAAIACHSSVTAIDHLGEIITQYGSGSVWGNMKLHHTKCIGLIKNVISPALKDDTEEDIKNKPYALKLDESTDTSVQKYLCVLVRYFSDKQLAVTTELLGLVPLIESNAEAIFQAFRNKLTDSGLNVENCLGFAYDGASVMVGSHNSVWTRLQGVAPNCVLIKCICHSLALCIQHAMDELPSNINYLLSEIPNWFNKSAIRRDAFKQLFEVMNTNEDPDLSRTAPLPFKKVSSTRWLVKGKVLYNVLVNWEELLAYFTAVQSCRAVRGDVRYKSRLIKEMLQDRVNYLYFVFATPLVQEFERVNALFQCTNGDPHHLSQSLLLHYHSLYNRLYDSKGNRKMLTNVDFGVKFMVECEKFFQNYGMERSRDVAVIKTRCKQMMLVALEEVKKRLPTAQNMFENLSKISPQVILSQVSRCTFANLPFLKLFADKLDLLEDQYRKFILVDWKNEEIFKAEGIPVNNTEKFWVSILQHPLFQDLAVYALTCLVTPVSNAVLERIFSLLTAVKTKPRNRMETELLDGIVRIRTDALLKGKCCKDLFILEKMLQRFKSDIVCKQTASMNIL